MNAERGRVALICPGQGAQRPGGVSRLPPAARALFEQASAVIGLDLWAAGRDYPAERLALPSVLQPFLVAWAVAEVTHARATRPDLSAVDYCLGHSSGENAVLVLSGALSLEAGVRFAYERGKHLDLIRAAPPSGLLALTGAARARAEAIAASTGTVMANHNGPEQAVLGGSLPALERAAARAAAEGIAAVPLRLAGAFHTAICRRSDDLSAPLIAALPIVEPFVPIIGNAHGQVIDTAAALRAELHDQYTRPIEWVAALQTAHDRGVRTALVTGPGSAMAGLVRGFNHTLPEPIRIVRLAAPETDEAEAQERALRGPPVGEG